MYYFLHDLPQNQQQLNGLLFRKKKQPEDETLHSNFQMIISKQ